MDTTTENENVSLNDSFNEKIKMKSYGNQTISDNSLLDAGKGIILYCLEGNIIVFDCNKGEEIKTKYISYSLIKIIQKIPMTDNYLICCENGHIFILDNDYKILYNYKPKEVNNVYYLDISEQMKKNNSDKIYQYIVISHHSITKDDYDYYLVHTKDALSLIEMEISLKENEINEINFKKIFTKESFNDLSVFNSIKKNGNGNDNLELISFKWDETDTKNKINIYKINENNINNNSFNEKEIIIDQISTKMKRYKKYITENNELKIVIECLKRNLYIFNLNTLSIDDYFKLEGSGELGEFHVDSEKKEILIVNDTAQIIKINISVKIYPKLIPLNKNENNLSEIIIKDEDFIRSMAWGLISIKCKNDQNKIVVINAAGIKIYSFKDKWIEDNYLTSIIKMTGCGACSISNNIFAYGDFLGNITIFDYNKEKYEQIQIENDMIRSLCGDKYDKTVYIGTLSGKLYKYDYNKKKLTLINYSKDIDNDNDNNDDEDGEESITCIRYLHPNIYLSDTGGNIFIYNVNEETTIFNFLAHEPVESNADNEFGSLSIKSEIWSFIVNEIDDENIYIATGSEDQTIKIWKIKVNNKKNNIKKNNLIKEIKEHNYAVTCLDWSNITFDNENIDVLLSCSDDKTINIFDSTNETFDLILKVDFSSCIYGFFTLTYCSFNHCDKNSDNNLLCIGTQAGYLIIYDLLEQKIKFLEKIHYGGIEGVVFENNIISTCGNDNVFNVIEINNNN